MPYPDDLPQVERLIAQHRQLEPVLLAIYFCPDNDTQDVHLLEVISEFGYNEINVDQDMFEMEYGSTAGFPLPDGSHLHIVLTNAPELSLAVRQNWPSLASIKSAIEQGNYHVVHQEGEGAKLLASLKENLVAA